MAEPYICYDCSQLTNGNCGKHGYAPTYATASTDSEPPADDNPGAHAYSCGTSSNHHSCSATDSADARTRADRASRVHGPPRPNRGGWYNLVP